MSMTYTKLFSSITESTIWMEDHVTRLVWVCMLAMADKHGRVWGSIPGLANRARVTLPECEIALLKFLAPDLYSRTKTNDGKRIMVIDGGWRLLNHGYYRDIQDVESQKAYKAAWAREKRKRDKEAKALGVDTNVDKKDESGLKSIGVDDIAEASPYAEAKALTEERESMVWRNSIQACVSACGMAGVPIDFIETIWHEHNGTGIWKDWRGHEITRIGSYIKSRYDKSESRKTERNNHGQGNNTGRGGNQEAGTGGGGSGRPGGGQGGNGFGSGSGRDDNRARKAAANEREGLTVLPDFADRPKRKLPFAGDGLGAKAGEMP